jgi:hypothetical protein
MASVPVDFNSAPAPLSFASLLWDVWRLLYPSGEMPRYQVFQTPIGGVVFEYQASVQLTANFPLGHRAYSFRGGYASTPDRAVQLAALAGLTVLRHQERAMQENRAFQYYPTLATTPRRTRFPPVRQDDDATIVFMSRYMIAEYVLIAELARDATRARRALGIALAPPASPPAPSLSSNPPSERNP